MENVIMTATSNPGLLGSTTLPFTAPGMGHAHVLDKFQIIPNKGGKIKIPLFGAVISTGSVEENTSKPNYVDSSQIYAQTLTPKRISNTISISKQLLNDAPEQTRAQIKQVMELQLRNNIERQILGNKIYDGDNLTMTPLIELSESGPTTTYTINDAKIDYATAMKVYQNFATSTIDIPFSASNAASDKFWVFNRFPQVLDAQGNNVITYENLPVGAIGRLFGAPIYTGLTSNRKIDTVFTNYAAVLVNPSAYVVTMSDITITETVDEVNGTVQFTGNVYADGALTFGPQMAQTIKYTTA